MNTIGWNMAMDNLITGHKIEIYSDNNSLEYKECCKSLPGLPYCFNETRWKTTVNTFSSTTSQKGPKEKNFCDIYLVKFTSVKLWMDLWHNHSITWQIFFINYKCTIYTSRRHRQNLSTHLESVCVHLIYLYAQPTFWFCFVDYQLRKGIFDSLGKVGIVKHKLKDTKMLCRNWREQAIVNW